MKKLLLTSLFSTVIISGCGGSSNKSSPSPEFSYLFKQTDSGFDIRSYNFKNDDISLITDNPQALEITLTVSSDTSADGSALAYLKDGAWYALSRNSAQPTQISNALLQSELCDSFAFADQEKTYIYYSTAGIDEDCASEADNVSYRIDTGMDASTAPISIANNMQLDINNTDAIFTEQKLSGLLIHQADGDVLYTDINANNSVQLATGISGFVRLKNFSASSNKVLQLDKKIYNLSADDMTKGSLGSLVFSATHNAPLLYSNTQQLYYRDADNGKVYHFNPDTSSATLVFDAAVGFSGISINGVEIGAKSLLINMNSNQVVSVNIENLNNISRRTITYEFPDTSSSVASVDGGFVLGGRNQDGSHEAAFINDAGAIIEINDAEWLRIESPDGINNIPVLIRSSESENTLSYWSTSTSKEAYLLGNFPAQISDFRSDIYVSTAGKILLTSQSETESDNGVIYTLNFNRANSLQNLNLGSGYTVFF